MWKLLEWVRQTGRAPLPSLVIGITSVDSPSYNGRASHGTVPVFTYCKNDGQPELLWPSYAWWGWPEIPSMRPWHVMYAAMLAAVAAHPLAARNETRLGARMTLVNNGLRGRVKDLIQAALPDRLFFSEDVVVPPVQQAEWRALLYVPGMGCSVSLATKLFSGAAVVAVQDPHRMNEFYSSEASACMANVLTQGKWEETLIRMVRRVTAEPGTGDDPPPPPPELVLELGQCGYDYMRRFVAPQHVYMFMERSLREYGAKLATRPVTEAELLDAGFTKLEQRGYCQTVRTEVHNRRTLTVVNGRRRTATEHLALVGRLGRCYQHIVD